MEKQKRKRTLHKPMKKWTLDEETKILDFLIANKPIEMPTARVYYTQLIDAYKWTIDYGLIRHKVKNMKQLYYKTLSWRQASTENGDYDDHMIREYLKRRCPHFKKLETLFSADLQAKKAKQPWSVHKVEEIDLSVDDSEDTFLDFKVEVEEPELSFTDPLNEYECAKEPQDHQEMEMSKEEVSLKWMRLEIEKEKLSIAREKIAMQREHNQEEAKFRILQLEQQGLLKRLQIEKEAEVKKYELSLKYKGDPKTKM